MPALLLSLSILMGVLCWGGVHCDDDDDDIEGPLLPIKADGTMYNTAEIIKERKYTAENHTVTTEDGYLLGLYRVRTDKPTASPVLLQHGYLLSSDGWVTDVDALAFKLSDAGFDVWINNLRGNAYSRAHTKLKPVEEEFWNFSWHEMGTKDLPAVIDYILKKTGQGSLHYIGHSLGTTVSYVMTSVRPEYNQKLKSLVCLGPVVFLSKMQEMMGPDGMVEEIMTKYMKAFKSVKWEVFPRKDLETDNKTQITCNDIEESMRDMCVDKIEGAQKVLGGPYLPAGQASKTMHHLHQLAVAGVMKWFKFDTPEENKKAYGGEEPPSYTDKFKLITAPTLLWSTENDQIIMSKDVEDLVPLLPNLVANNIIKDECFDHVTFLFPRMKSCMPVRAKLYNDVIEAIKKLEKIKSL